MALPRGSLHWLWVFSAGFAALHLHHIEDTTKLLVFGRPLHMFDQVKAPGSQLLIDLMQIAQILF